MKQANELRMKEIETALAAQKSGGLFVDGHDNVIRVDVSGKRGKERTFASTYEAKIWLEQQIDAHPAAHGSYSVEDICDLYADNANLKSIIAEVFAGKVVKTNGGKLGAGQLYGLLFGTLKTDEPADLNLWMLSGAMRYFRTPEFKSRFEARATTDDDGLMFIALLVIYSWGKPGTENEIKRGYLDLLKQVTGLPIAAGGLYTLARQD